MLHKKVPVYNVLLAGTHFSKKSLYIANYRQVHLLSQKFSATINIQAGKLGVKKSLYIAMYRQVHDLTKCPFI